MAYLLQNTEKTTVDLWGIEINNVSPHFVGTHVVSYIMFSAIMYFRLCRTLNEENRTATEKYLRFLLSEKT